MPEPPSLEKTTETHFHQLVGYCITTWAEVEDQLFQVFWKTMKCPQEQAAIVYFRCPGLDARFNLTEELVEAALPKPQRKSGGHAHPSFKEWKNIAKEFRELLATRRRIAHHPTKEKKQTNAVGLWDTFSWFEIYVHENEQLRGQSEHLRPLVAGDLQSHHIRTLALKSTIQRFYSETLLKHVE
jgi:hypothetical protein